MTENTESICTECHQKFDGRHKSPYVLVCSNNCFNWFHNFDCLQRYLLKISGLHAIPEGKDQHGPQLTIEKIKEIADKIKKLTPHLKCQSSCDGDLIGAKKLINLDQLQKRRRYGVYTKSSDIYEQFTKNRSQWGLTMKKNIRDLFNEYTDNIKWRFFKTDLVKLNNYNTRNYRTYAKQLFLRDKRLRSYQTAQYYASRPNELKIVNEVKEQMLELNKLIEI